SAVVSCPSTRGPCLRTHRLLTGSTTLREGSGRRGGGYGVVRGRVMDTSPPRHQAMTRCQLALKLLHSNISNGILESLDWEAA
ncbi:unnamed protein product, partial [Mycena citricolor]